MRCWSICRISAAASTRSSRRCATCWKRARKAGKSVWILDRPNPAGRPVEGLTLRAGWESFVGAGPMPMRHGLTLGELAHWFVRTLKLDVDYQVIEMEGWKPDSAPGYGWPLGERSWVNPSPNAANLWMARAYAGTVMVEGTTLSEGRGTTRPLELFGAPDIDADALLKEMHALAPHWLQGLPPAQLLVRAHVPQACAQAVRRHPDPRRRSSLRSRCLPPLAPGGARASRRCAACSRTTRIWRDFPYEYEKGRLAIDVINGSELLREWVDDPRATPADLDALVTPDEKAWRKERKAVLLY